MAASLLANHTLRFLLVLFGAQSPSRVTQAPSHFLTTKAAAVLCGMATLASWLDLERRTIGPCLHRVTQAFSNSRCLSHQPCQTTKCKCSCSGCGEAEITRLILNMARFELSVLQPDCTDCTGSSHTFGLRSFVAWRVWVFKSHPFGMLQPDFSCDFKKRSVGALLREPQRLHGTICWEASRIAAGVGGGSVWLPKLWGAAEQLGVLSIACTGSGSGLASPAAVRHRGRWSEPGPRCSNL